MLGSVDGDNHFNKAFSKVVNTVGTVNAPFEAVDSNDDSVSSSPFEEGELHDEEEEKGDEAERKVVERNEQDVSHEVS